MSKENAELSGPLGISLPRNFPLLPRLLERRVQRLAQRLQLRLPLQRLDYLPLNDADIVVCAIDEDAQADENGGAL
jgi:hypothetical protein